MAIIRHTNFDMTVENIAERNAITARVDGMMVVVIDAIADADAGAGKAIYRWDATDNNWIMVSKGSVQTVSFATEELIIANGQVSPANIPLNNNIWDISIVENDIIKFQPKVEALSISPTVIGNLSLYNGKKLRFTYAYGTITTQMQSIIDDLEVKIVQATGGIPTKAELDAVGIDAATVTGWVVDTNVPADAVFTDTIYTKPVSEPISYIDGLQAALDIATNPDMGSLSGDILPSVTKTYNIGSDTKRWKGIYVDEAYLSMNTLYIGGTPVLGTDADNIIVKADIDQSITVQTKGLGVTNITSENEVSVSTVGTNADIVVQATGTNSKVKIAGANGIELSSVLNAQSDVNVSGNFTLSGNFIHNGSQFTVNATTVTTKDNIIVVNQGEVGSGVTAGKAGIQIDRGDAADYQLVFDESTDKFVIGQVGGTFETLSTREYVDAGLSTGLNLKVDKISGKGLSTEDYSTAEKSKLSGIAAGAQVNVATDLSLGTITGTTIPLNSSTGTDVTLPSATTTLAGLMSGTDKSKLDGIAASANNYSLPVASSTVLGGVKAGTNVTIDANGVISANDSSVAWSEITSKPTFATVATSGSYSDLSNKPTIPTVPTVVSSFTNDSDYQTSAQVNTAIQAVVGAAPAALDTLAEIATQLANDESAVSALTTTVSGKAAKATTLSGYGITDAYTKTEFGTLADFTTALS